ncbi:MAG: NAD(P)-dependent oxidoreductase [Candidatus Shapirobacteria bacterium]|nr:NAD(P)-dependent oxidoreductase [Candidatus Shapirobacteria bacterium]
MGDKRIFLITGASGFIGSVLLHKLTEQKQTVHLILRNESKTWRIADLLDKVTIHYSDLSNVSELTKIIKKIKPNIIYHLATNGAYSYQKDANQIIETNILGTWNLLQACNTTNYDLFVNTGSSSEYGLKKNAMKETDLLEPASYYAVTKCAQTLLCSHIAKQEHRPIVTIRPFSVYGPYEEPKRFVPTLMNALFFNKEMNLVAPETARDQIYVDDMVDAYLKIEELKNNPGEYFNIGTGIQSTIKEVVDTAVKVTGKTAQFKWGGMEKKSWDTNHWVADVSKAGRLLKWTPKINLEQGLKLTWDWFQNNHKFYQDET